MTSDSTASGNWPGAPAPHTAGPHTTGGHLPQLQGAPVRLIASDIDGTILSYRSAQTGLLSPRTVEAFHAAKAAGIVVVLVTGRPVRALRAISETLATVGPVVASNGAVTYDLSRDELITSDPLSAAALFRAKDLVAGLDPQVTFAAETLDHLHLEESFARGSLWFDEERRRAVGIRDEELRFGPLDLTLQRDSAGAAVTPGADVGRRHVSDSVVKLLAKTASHEPDAFLGEAQRRIGQLATVTHSAPGVSMLEISSRGVNKAAALQRFAAGLGIDPGSTIAFGDMPNDVEMLRWAGTSWAVGSGHPAAQAAATWVTASCDDDGVARVIEQLLDGRLT
ncbi:MAG: Cof-type HAD-IIB family hydrolase [Nesterenkonia sp.]